MRRDPGDPSGQVPAGSDARDRSAGPDEGGPASDELLTAYVDGIAELAPEDRRRIEARLARDPAARAEQAAVRALLERLRSTSDAPGSARGEPDWAAMERSIRLAVGPELPRPWWRRWRWLAPAVTFATAATVMVLMWSRPAPVVAPELAPPPGSERVAPTAQPPDAVVPLWLDGDEVDVDLSASDLLGDPGFADDEADRATADEVRLLPATDLAWVDHLDDAALDRAERWLARKKG